MTTPRTRNEFAAQEGVDGGGTAGLPPREYCTHCLNTNTGVCGSVSHFDVKLYFLRLPIAFILLCDDSIELYSLIDSYSSYH